MTFEEFIAKYNDQDVNFEGCPTNSCMALLHLYLQEVLGIQDPATLAAPFAADLFVNFEQLTGHEQFTLVTNTPDGVPAEGDIVVWGRNEGAGIPDGHVAVFHDGDANAFNSFDSNFPTGSKPHIENHSYTDVAGWLHYTGAIATAGESVTPTPQDNIYKGLDLTNLDSVKAAIDTWDEVANQGLFVRKSEVEPQLENLNTQVQALTNHSNELQNQLNAAKPADGSVTVTPEVKQSLLEKIAALAAEFEAKFNGQSS